MNDTARGVPGSDTPRTDADTVIFECGVPGLNCQEIMPASLGREMERELTALRALVNTPETTDFLRGVRIEAAHQRERWGSEHDAGKASEDWFWLIGYLAGKALHAAKAEALPRYRHIKRGGTYEVLSTGEDENRRGVTVVVYRGEDDGKIWVRPADQFFDGRFEALPTKVPEKALHHCISAAAALANWHAALSGVSNAMRPGIDPVARGIEGINAVAVVGAESRPNDQDLAVKP